MNRISRIQPIKQIYKGKHCNHDSHENFVELLAKEKKKHHD